MGGRPNRPNILKGDCTKWTLSTHSADLDTLTHSANSTRKGGSTLLWVNRKKTYSQTGVPLWKKEPETEQ